MARIIPAFTQFFDDNGDPLVNGYLYFYKSGTNNTPKTTYADINETIANANPVPLDGSGRCPSIFGTGVYNVISASNALVQIQQFDPVGGEITGSAFTVWDAVTSYPLDFIVTGSDSKYYKSLSSGNQNNDPTLGSDQWQEIDFTYIWSQFATYDTGDVVESGGYFYRSTIDDNIGNTPATNLDKWESAEDRAALAIAAPDRIQPVDASVASNALTVTINPTVLDFRSATLNDGDITHIVVDAPVSMTVSSGSTLGTVNAVEARLAILAINNAGTVETAIVNLAGGLGLSESGVISTTAEGGAGGADSANVIYSTTARSNVPYRVAGYIDITEATAGTWATGPTLIQGAGGNALESLHMRQTSKSASGTSVDFLNVPPGTKRITFALASLSSNGTADYDVRLGTSSGFVATGYSSTYGYITGANTCADIQSTTGFNIVSNAASEVHSGVMTLIHIGSNVWAQSNAVNRDDPSASGHGSGVVTLSGECDRIQIATDNGTDTFDAGIVGVMYE